MTKDEGRRTIGNSQGVFLTPVWSSLSDSKPVSQDGLLAVLRPSSFVAALVVTFVAYLARVWALGDASLWYDEGYSIAAARRDLPGLFATLVPADNNPPLHYLFLHFGILVAGASEFATRYVSLIPGVLLVPLAYATVREVYHGQPEVERVALWAGIPAATLVGLSPYLLFYAQEARMYSQLACLALAAVLTLLRATRGASWLPHSLILAAMLYTHYAAVLLLPALAVYALLCGWRTLGKWLLALGGAWLLWLLWLPSLLSQVRRFGAVQEYYDAQLSFLGVLAEIWTSFTAVSIGWLAALAGIVVIGLAMVCVGWLRTRDRVLARRLALLVLAAAMPMLLTALAATIIPKFVPRYAIVGAPALYVALPLLLYTGLGWRGGVRRVAYGAVVLVAVLLSARLAWSAAYTPWLSKDNARGIATYLNERAEPEHVVVHVRGTPEGFDYYYRGVAPRYAFDVGFDYAVGAARLNEVLQSRPRRVWLVLWQHEFTDPSGFVVAELTRRSEKPPTVRTSYAGYTLLRFDLDDWSPVVAHPEPAIRVDGNFGDRLTLVGADRLMDTPGYLRWILYWSAQQPIDRDYAVAVQLRDAAGAVRLTHNQSPSTPYLATAGFPVDRSVRGLTQVKLPDHLPPGTYEVDVVVWDTREQRNLTLYDTDGRAAGIAASLGRVDITPAMLPR